MGRDAARNQTVLFVGTRYTGSPSVAGETLVWDGFGWSPRPTATHPYPVTAPSMAFDPIANATLFSDHRASVCCDSGIPTWIKT